MEHKNFHIVEKECKKCGLVFKRKSTSRKQYCDDCFEEKKVHYSGKTKIVKCVKCFKDFEVPKQSSVKICKKCKIALSKLDRICKDCKEIFYVEYSTSRKQYCDKCKKKNDKVLRNKTRRLIKCLECNFEFETDKIYIVCPECNCYMLKCDFCEGIFQREHKYSRMTICIECFEKLKEKIKVEYKADASINALIKKYKGRFVRKCIEKKKVKSDDYINL